jgi:hypothetical protein
VFEFFNFKLLMCRILTTFVISIQVQKFSTKFGMYCASIPSSRRKKLQFLLLHVQSCRYEICIYPTDFFYSTISNIAKSISDSSKMNLFVSFDCKTTNFPLSKDEMD